MSKTPIRYAHIDGSDGGFEFGCDAVTAVRWLFQNRTPARAYTTIDLTPFHKNERVQEYLQAHRSLCLSFVELKALILELSKETQNEPD